MSIYLNRYRYSNNPASVGFVIQIAFFPPFPAKVEKAEVSEAVKGREATEGLPLTASERRLKCRSGGKAGTFFVGSIY